MGPLAVGLISLLFLALNWQPASRVVMLPDAAGTTGSVVVRSDAGQTVLSGAYASVSIDAGGALNARQEDGALVLKHYEPTLAARPQAPVSFILYFEFGSAVDIAPAFKPVLEQLLAVLASYPAPEITVIGHTDRVGSLESNDRLSLQRADTVRDLLLRAGVKAVVIDVAGRGEREPMIQTADEVAEEKNRRVEINLR